VSEPRIHFETLPSGLTLLLREAHAAPVASLQIWTRVGSADERPHEAGLAHFHEHMLFKGTARRGVGEIAGEVEGVGGRINAYTTFDTTVYHATLPADALGSGLDVLADAVRHSTFDPDEVTREIGVVLEEIHRAADTPGHVLGDAVFATAYQAHPYRNPILGSESSVSAITRERLLDFFRRWYAPDRFVVVAAGDFDAGSLAAQVKRAFEGAVPGGDRQARPAEPPQRGLRTVLLERPFERSSLELVFPATSLAHADTPYLDLLAFVLGEGDSSRLVRRVKEREGLADRIDAGCYTPLEPGLLSVSADLDAERVPGCLEAVVRELERVRHQPPSADELEKARANFLASEHFERESVSGMAGKLGSFQVLAGDFRHERSYMEAIRTATPEDLRRVAHAYFAPERLTVGVLREAGAAPLSEKDVRDAIERGAAAAASGGRARALGAPRRRSRPGPAPGAARSHPAGIRSYELEGGAQLHVAPRNDVPVVGVRAALRGGLLAESEPTAGIGQFTTQTWLRGTRARSAAELARAIESLAADLDGFSGRNSLGLGLDVTSDRLEPALDLFAEVLLEPAFDAGEIERQRRDTLALIARREDRLDVRAFDLFQAALYRVHPYRLPVVGTAESVARFDRAALLEHHARLVRAPGLVLAVAGDVDPDAVAAGLARRLADLGRGPAPWAEPPEEPGPTEPREVELRKAREQAHLVMGFHGLTVRDADRFALAVISQLLAGQGGRLFLELRDRRGLAYSVNAVDIEGLAPGLFAVYVATAPDKLAEARATIFAELRRLLDSPPPADELERARRYLAGNFEIDRQRAAARAAHMSADARYGLGPDAQYRYAEQVEAVDAEAVLRVARRVIDLDAWVAAAIRP
jgi:zinc protease